MQQRKLKGKFETINDFQVRPKGQTWSETVKCLWFLTKIVDGDMVAMEEKYYNHCLGVFYKSVNNVTKTKTKFKWKKTIIVFFMGLFYQK